jgi:isopenicillin N synthase-like dioxygenase
MPDLSIPLIDCGGMRPGADRGALGQALCAAAQDSGFMRLRNTGLDPALLQTAFASSKRFFALPDAAKEALRYRDIQRNHGYVAVGQEALDPLALADRKESFTMRDALRSASDVTAWPDPAFRNDALALFAAARALAEGLLDAIGLALGLQPGYFAQRHRGENQTLRFLHYPPQYGGDLAAGAGAHTDYGSLTLLWQDGNPGLEVRAADGAWLPVPAEADAVVVNTGDLLERWSNGRFRSTLHRVCPLQPWRSRYSIAFFSDPDDAVLVSPLEGCVPAGQSPAYAPIPARDHILHKLAASYG